MRFLQVRRRRHLRRMIVNGEIDVESLGVKRLQVPDDVLNKMPIITFAQSGADGKEEAAGGKDASFAQPTCPICIEDYESSETQVRQLPCKHIYHAACIDPLLREYSSLCPICKRSVLPPGYCPPITNLMVRRERMLRRLGGQTPASWRRVGLPDSLEPPPGSRRHFAWHGRHNRINATATAAGTPAPDATQAGTEMTSVAPPQPRRRPANVSRADWARRRAPTLVGVQSTIEAEEQREEVTRSRWRKALSAVFPTAR